MMGLVSFFSTQGHYLWGCYVSLGEGPQCPRRRRAGWRMKPDALEAHLEQMGLLSVKNKQKDN